MESKELKLGGHTYVGTDALLKKFSPNHPYIASNRPMGWYQSQTESFYIPEYPKKDSPNITPSIGAKYNSQLAPVGSFSDFTVYRSRGSKWNGTSLEKLSYSEDNEQDGYPEFVDHSPPHIAQNATQYGGSYDNGVR